MADLGAGGGWFTVRLGRRVGPTRPVYAEDIQPQMVDAIGAACERENLSNVEAGARIDDDPRLPPGIDAALISALSRDGLADEAGTLAIL